MYKKIRKIILNYIPNLIKTELLYRLPFLYIFFEIKPSSSTVMITNRCNLKCIMCKQWKELPKEELSTNDWKQIIIDLKKNGINNIHFTGGEPFLRKDLAELISYSVRNGFTVGITTNGILITREILEDLIRAGLKSIAISIDAISEGYDTIRGIQASYSKLEISLSIVAEIRKRRRMDAYINFTLMKDNIKELKKVKGFADEVELPLAICLLDKNSFLFDLEENNSKFWITEEKDLEDLRGVLNFLRNEKIKNPKSLIINFPAIDFIEDYFRDPRQENIPCVSSQDRVIIDPYGNLLGGCMSMGNFGNIKEKNFAELQKEKRYKIAKKDMFFKRCKGCSCGYLFNIRLFLPLVVKDIVDKIRYQFNTDDECLKKN